MDSSTTENQRITGSSVLPFAIDPQWNCIYFLLAQERVVPGWSSGSQTWSDFGGAAQLPCDTACETAGREFVEESMGLIRFSPGDSVPYESHAPVSRALSAGEFALSVTFTMRSKSTRYITFLKQIDFDRHAMHKHEITFCALRDKGDGKTTTVRHPLLSREGTVPDCYLEKTAIRWWSVPQLYSAMRRTRGNNERLRSSFANRLRVILKEFPKDGRIQSNGPRWEHVFPITTYHNPSVYKTGPRAGKTDNNDDGNVLELQHCRE